MTKSTKKWQQMTAEERARATAKYDEPFAADKYFRAISGSKRAAHLRALRRGAYTITSRTTCPYTSVSR